MATPDRPRRLIDRLIEDACTAHLQMRQHEAEAASAAVRMADALAAARGLCAPAEWGAILSRLGVAEGTAQDLLAIHRVGLGSFGVVDLGGLTLAGLWAARQKLPGAGEVLTVTAEAWDPQHPPPVVYIWQAGDGHCVGRVRASGPDKSEVMTREPITEERPVWQCVWLFLEPRFAEVTMGLLEGDAADVVEMLEAQRQEMNRGLEDGPL